MKTDFEKNISINTLNKDKLLTFLICSTGNIKELSFAAA